MLSHTAPGHFQSSSASASTRNPDEAGFGVYVHWPFCAQKCPYCDFNSHVRSNGWDEGRFLAAYRSELSYSAARTGPRTVSSVFFGGGTPSLMQAETVGSILDHIADLWSIEPDAEITLEANPGSVEANRLRGYRLAGVNRISLGVQSLRDTELKALGRVHSVAEAKVAIGIATDVFDRVSFDLIYARPHQSAHEWRAELTEALAMSAGHLSLYQLTIEPETAFAKLHAAGKLIVPDPEAARALYGVTKELTEAAGLPAYEISNHARPGDESRHNLLYWRYGEYAGVGPGAHGRMIWDDTRTATSALKSPEAWAERVATSGHGFESVTALSRDEEADELLLMGMRLSEGLDLGRLAKIGGAVLDPAVVEDLVDLQLIERSAQGKRIRATAEGRIVLDALVTRLSGSLKTSDAN